MKDSVHGCRICVESGLPVLKAFAEHDGTDVVGHTGRGQFGQLHWRPLVVLDCPDVVGDLLLDLLGQDVLAHTELP